MRTMSQIGYGIDELLKEKDNLKRDQTAEKVDEFVKILTDIPPKNDEDLKRVLKMFAQEIKYIVEQ